MQESLIRKGLQLEIWSFDSASLPCLYNLGGHLELWVAWYKTFKRINTNLVWAVNVHGLSKRHKVVLLEYAV